MTFFFISLFMILVFLRPQEWLFPFLYGTPLLDTVVVLAIFSFMFEYRSRKEFFPSRDYIVIFLLIGLWFSAVFSHAVHFYYEGVMFTVGPAFKLCFFTYLLFYIIDTPRKLQIIGIIFVFMAIIMVVHAVLQVHTGYGFTGHPPIFIRETSTRPEQIRPRFFGIFNDPNDLAQMLLISLPYAFVLRRKRDFLNLFSGLIIASFILYGVIISRSRGGFVGLGSVFFTFLGLIFPPRFLPIWLLITALVGLILIPFSSPFIDRSAYDRVIFWGEANWAFKTSPLFGVGYNMFSDFVSDSRAAHNAFVETYVELGIVGYWFWFNLLWMAILGCIRTRNILKDVKEDDAVWLRRFSGLTLVSIVGFCVTSYFLTRGFVYPLFFLIAIGNALPNIAQRFLPFPLKVINFKKDILLMGTILSFGSIGYIYLSILFINRVWSYISL